VAKSSRSRNAVKARPSMMKLGSSAGD